MLSARKWDCRCALRFSSADRAAVVVGTEATGQCKYPWPTVATDEESHTSCRHRSNLGEPRIVRKELVVARFIQVGDEPLPAET